MNCLNSPITPKEMDAVIKSLLAKKKKSPEPNGFSAKFYQTFHEDLRPILFKEVQRIEMEETLPNSFYEATVTLIFSRVDGMISV
jgi:hypothetical protein